MTDSDDALVQTEYESRNFRISARDFDGTGR
jgi:hypothetical protein